MIKTLLQQKQPSINQGLAVKKKALFTTAFASALLFILVIGAILVESAKANFILATYLPEIVINSDGTIVINDDGTILETSLITRTGNVYTLTANVDAYAIRIKRSNIVFDGAGYTLNTTNGDNSGLLLGGVNNVIVKNLEIFSGYYSIDLFSCSNCLITNVKTNHRILLRVGSSSNTITNSTIHGLNVGNGIGTPYNNLVTKNDIFGKLSVYYGSNNRFYQNNFFLDDFPSISGDNFWGKGSVGNYWSD